LTAADKARILRWEYCFKRPYLLCLYLPDWNVSGSNKIFRKSFHIFHIISAYILLL